MAVRYETEQPYARVMSQVRACSNLGEYRDSEPARARFWEDKHMRKNLTEIVFILDRSGSMSGLERDTIGGFNSMIEQQKKAEGEADLNGAV